MQVNIRVADMELTPSIKEYTEKKVYSLEKYAPKDGNMTELQAWVDLGFSTKHHQSGDIFRAEIQFQLPRETKMIRAEAETPDLYASIDEAHEKMKTELQKIKDKKISFLRRGRESVKNLFQGIRKNR